MVVVALPDGTNTVREEREIFDEFVSTKIYDYVKNPVCTNPQQIIRDWLLENYNCKDELQKYNLESFFFQRI